jgi:hypothetical protein
VTGDHNVDVLGGPAQSVECGLVGGHLAGAARIKPSSPRTAMALLQTHSLYRTHTPSATSFSIG